MAYASSFSSLLLVGAGSDRCPEKLGLNAVILVLNWLYLGKPRLCPANLELDFGSLPSPAQERAIRSLRLGIKIWNANGSVGPTDMGRAASKFEALEDLLRACQREWAALPRDALPCEARLDFTAASHALPVRSERLTFVGKPSFDPEPFLDARNRKVYHDPLEHARPLAPEASVPRVKVNASRAEALRLLELLDSTDRLKLVKADEVRPRLRCGVFALAKGSARDRLILDARAPNMVESIEDRWIKSLGSLEQLQFLYLPPELDLETHTEDFKEFYHGFIISDRRCLRNALAIDLTFDEVKHLKCCSPGLAGHRIVPCLATLAMGDCNAVAFGQCSHLSVILRSSSLQLKDFVCLLQRPPRPGRLVAGLLIDDFVLLDPVPRGLKSSVEPPGVKVVAQVLEGHKTSGLPRNPAKAVSRSLLGEFWGGILDGKKGTLRPHPRRTVPLAAFLLEVVRGKISSVGMLEVLAGGLVSAFQLRRRLLSLLEHIYLEQKHRADRAFCSSSRSLSIRATRQCCAFMPGRYRRASKGGPACACIGCLLTQRGFCRR